jgi:hypothetical protein
MKPLCVFEKLACKETVDIFFSNKNYCLFIWHGFLFVVFMAKNYRLALKVEEKNNEAMVAEEEGNMVKAVKLYEQNIKEDYADEFAFERLMIIYRKQKEYADELRVINRGIALFQQNMKDHLKNSLSRHIDGKKLEQLSNAIMKKTGANSTDLHFPDPIDKWIKRKEIVEKKLEK